MRHSSASLRTSADLLETEPRYHPWKRGTGQTELGELRQHITKGPPAAVACGDLRPNRPNTGGAGDES